MRLAIAAGLIIAVRWTHIQVGETYVTAAAAAIMVHYLVAEANGMYRSWRTDSAEREILCTLVTWALTCPLLFGVGALAGYAAHFPVRLLLAWGIAGAVVVTVTRMVFADHPAESLGPGLSRAAVCRGRREPARVRAGPEHRRPRPSWD